MALKKLRLCTGIGDNFWLFQKLINVGEPFDISFAGDCPYKRAAQLNDLLPQLFNSYKYEPSFNTGDVLAKNIQHALKNWADIYRDHADFYIAPNYHLETGKRLEDFLPDLATSFDMRPHCRTDNFKPLAKLLLPNSNMKYIGIYMSGYSSSRHWGFWQADKWVKLCDMIHQTDKTKFTFVLIGAPYDLDLGTEVARELMNRNIPFVNTIGQTLPVVVEMMKLLFYGFYFPSGIGVLAASMYSPHTMFFPPHLNSMMDTFQAPELIANNEVKHALFCEPEEHFKWWVDVYKGLEK